jgi:hypothetical protein
MFQPKWIVVYAKKSALATFSLPLSHPVFFKKERPHIIQRAKSMDFIAGIKGFRGKTVLCFI